MADTKHSVETMLDAIRDRIAQKTPGNRVIEPTAVPGLMFYRRETDEQVDTDIGQIMVTLIVQGAKSTTVGTRIYNYRRGQCLICALAVPSVFHAVGASSEKPFLSLSLPLRIETLVELAQKKEMPMPKKQAESCTCVYDADEQLVDAFRRLAELADHPEEIPFVFPLVEREIHYRLLTSPVGEDLLSLVTSGTQSNAIFKAVASLRNNFNRPFTVEALAESVHMSTSNFHRRFKDVTGVSPLRYQKMLRLYEAKSRLQAGGAVSTISYDVGYESTSQFIREYKREFGETPTGTRGRFMHASA